MTEKIITKELAKLYEKQGYLEYSLACYIELYDKTKNQEYADAIEEIKKKINPDDQIIDDEENENDPDKTLPKPIELEKKQKNDNRALKLFEEWLNMIILEKKIESFKKIQQKHG